MSSQCFLVNECFFSLSFSFKRRRRRRHQPACSRSIKVSDHLGCIGRDGVFETWYNLGNSYLKRGELDRALNAYSKAIESSKGFVAPRVTLGQLHNNMGVAYKRKEDFESAIQVRRRRRKTRLWVLQRSSSPACVVPLTSFSKFGFIPGV